MAAHAVLSASGSATWINCTGSRKAQRGFPDVPSSAAEEGTFAHELGSDCLSEEIDADEADRLNWPKDMRGYIQEYLDYVRSYEKSSSSLYVEERVDFSPWVPDGFGTADAAIADGRTCHVFDLKYGKGVQVYPENNSQLLLYALGVYNELNFIYNFTEFVLHIVQPRKFTPEPRRISVEDLLKFAAEVKVKAEEAMTNDAPRTPGEKQCQWCKAKASCSELADWVEVTIGAEFDDLEDLGSQLTDERRSNVLKGASLIGKFIKSVEADVFNRLDSGGEFPGWKLVEGKSNRKWTEDAEAWLKKELKAGAYKKSLIGLTDATKLLGAKEVDAHTTKPKGAKTLTTEEDSRPALKADETFEDES